MSTPARRDSTVDRVAAVERSCDLAWLWMLEQGLLSAHPDDLVSQTLAAIVREAREAEDLRRLPVRRWGP